MALALNVFTQDPGGKRITEIIMDEHGTIIQSYLKHHPFPIFEGESFTAGVMLHLAQKFSFSPPHHLQLQPSDV